MNVIYCKCSLVFFFFLGCSFVIYFYVIVMNIVDLWFSKGETQEKKEKKRKEKRLKTLNWSSGLLEFWVLNRIVPIQKKSNNNLVI